jgi:membrane protease YdiL (CAAX protease family)
MYHRLARTEHYRWWKPIVEVVLFVVVLFALWFLLMPEVYDLVGGDENGAPGIIKLGMTLACLIPASLLAARIVGRPARSLLSVEMRFRGRWFLTCCLVTIMFIAAQTVIGLAVSAGPERGGWVGWDRFLPLALAVVLVIPLQASAEEFAFRGTLMQALGAWLRWPWVPIAITGVLFGLVHALPLEGFVAITTFGLVAGWLTIRTGGLEAAIALHVLNNVTFFLVDAATGRGDKWVTELNKEITWTATAFDVVINMFYGVIIAMLYSRRSLALADRPLDPVPPQAG